MVLRDATPVAFVRVRDAARAREFYVGVLGMELIEESPVATVVRTGSVTLRLTPVPDHHTVEGTVFGWMVDDVAAVMRDLAAVGVAPLRFDELEQDSLGVWRSPGGALVAWFADADANTLSVTQAAASDLGA